MDSERYIKGVEDVDTARELLREAGMRVLQKQAGNIPMTTDAPIRTYEETRALYVQSSRMEKTLRLMSWLQAPKETVSVRKED